MAANTWAKWSHGKKSMRKASPKEHPLASRKSPNLGKDGRPSPCEADSDTRSMHVAAVDKESHMHTHPPVDVLLRGQNTDGHLGLVEMVIAAGNGGPPLHVHPLHAEGFYLLDGELTVQVGDEVITSQAGSFFFAAPQTPHTFANFSGSDARILVLCSPAGFESYFEQLAAGVPASPPPG